MDGVSRRGRWARLVAILGFAMGLAACVPEDGAVPTSAAPANRPAPSTSTQPIPAGPLGSCLAAPQFEAPPLNPCAGPSIRLAFGGDVLLHVQLQEFYYPRGFASVWAQPARILRAADLAVINVEGPVAPGLARGGGTAPDPGPVFDDRVYTGYPQFNYNPVVLRDLKAAGVDLITTANNHAMDRGSAGVDATLAEAARAGLTPVGTITRGAERQFARRVSTRLGTVSFIACSFSTNGIADPGRQVLGCYANRSELLALVRAEAADPGVAGVVVLPHWGTEYASNPDGAQRGLARELAAAGATAVVGTHPHAVQPWAALAGPAGQVPVVYSTGNFVATQPFEPSKYEALALVEMCRGPSGRLVAGKAGWVAMEMHLAADGYWVNIAPRGSTGAAGAAERWLRRVAPDYAAQPAGCGG